MTHRTILILYHFDEMISFLVSSHDDRREAYGSSGSSLFSSLTILEALFRLLFLLTLCQEPVFPSEMLLEAAAGGIEAGYTVVLDI